MNKILIKTSFNERDKLGRPDWNLHFMAMTYVIANRSFDTSTKCGCIATKDNVILSTGFNGPPGGSLDDMVPINKRPDKYYFMEHSERNAIYNAAKIGISLDGCTFYVTGVPCIDCMRGMLRLHPKEIIYLCVNDTVMNHYKTDVGCADTWLQIVAPKTQVIEYQTYKAKGQIRDYLRTILYNTAEKLGI